MLLKELLERPRPASNLLVHDPFRDLDRDELVDEVVELANADIDGPRYILFGINAGAMDGDGLVGINEDTMTALKKAHRLFSACIDPGLDLAFIFDRINGKLLGALEIDGCDNGPYAVDPDQFETMAMEQPSIKKGADSQNDDADEVAEPVEISVTFSEPPGSELLELPVPDTSNSPSAREKHGIDWKKAIKETVDTVNTSIMRLAFSSMRGAEAEFDKGNAEAVLDKFEEPGDRLVDADNFYYFEEKAVKVNLTVCNKDPVPIEDAVIEISLPRAEDFDMADRLYSHPDDDSPLKEADMCSYPDVRRGKGGIWVRSAIGLLPPDRPKPAFESALRLVVGPGMQGRKVGISYSIRGKQHKQVFAKGTLKIKFGQIAK